MMSPDSPAGWDRMQQSNQSALSRTQSGLALNKRMVKSMDAFLVENQSQSVKVAARSLRDQQPGYAKSLKQRKKINKYIGMVPTAPVRDQPVGSEGDRVNLRFRFVPSPHSLTLSLTPTPSIR